MTVLIVRGGGEERPKGGCEVWADATGRAADLRGDGSGEVGDLAATHRHLEIAGRVLADQRFWFMSDHYDRARGLVACAVGDRDTSVERLGHAATEFLNAGALPYASYVLADLAEAALAAVRPKVAADAAGAAEDVARQLGRPQFAALAALAGAAAAQAVGRYDQGAEASHEAARLLSVVAIRPLGRGVSPCWGVAW
jgi:hypothetical protein